MPDSPGAARHVCNNRTALAVVLLAATAGLAACSSSPTGTGSTTPGTGGTVGAGITKPVKLAPFAASDSAGPTPGLPRVIAYAQDSSNETEQAIASGLQAGATDAGLKFEVTNSNGDPQQQVQNMQ